MKRLRFEVRRTDDGAGGFYAGKESVGSRAYKSDIVWLAAFNLTSAWENLRIRSELVIKSRDGRIQDTRTYGDDPRRTRG